MTSILMMVISISTMFGMSTSSIRTNARFLSDRMAYELDLTPMQYDDVYEINFDYIYAINRIMDDVVRGYRYAIDEYYELLDERNDDLCYVLNNRQYRLFMECDYFYRPVYSTGRNWAFRIHRIYSNHNFFYYDAPTHYRTYCGAHYHRNAHNYYSVRYNNQRNDRFTDRHNIRGSERHEHITKHDFGVNRRDPKDKTKDKNNYRNGNANNRENDSRYEHRQGNQNSPSINHRGNDNSNTGKGNGGNKTSGNTSTKPSNGGRGSSTGTQTTGTVTRGRR